MAPKKKAPKTVPNQDAELRALKQENERLRAEMSAMREAGQDGAASQKRKREDGLKWCSPGQDSLGLNDQLSTHELERYARHMSLPGFGIEGQAKLKNASVLIVGVGGLGSPAALYLAAAGVGSITLCDGDTVEVTNLQRQIIHAENRVGVAKAQSGFWSCKALNPCVNVKVELRGFTKHNAFDLLQNQTVVLDCTDNVPTRYMLSDACAALAIPLVSAAAVGLEGQLTVYNLHPDTPCYRCVWPKPPAAGDCTNCARGGVLGPVPGVMGVLQALEAVKVIAGLGETYAGRMLIFDACSAARPFTVMKLRERDTDKCTACKPFGSAYSDVTGFDYEKFTAGTCAVSPKSKLQEFINKEHSDQIISPHTSYVGKDCGIPMDTKAKPPYAGDSDQLHRMDTHAFSTYIKKTVIDVRPRHLSQTAMLEGALQIPLSEMEERFAEIKGHTKKNDEEWVIVCVCSRGNDSQLAASWLRSKGLKTTDLIGGMEKWKKDCDPTFPRLV